MLVDAQVLKKNRNSSIKLAALSASVPVCAAFYSWQNPTALWGWFIFAVVLFVIVFRKLTAKTRHRAQVLAQPFPAHYKLLLEQHVAYYNSLPEACQKRFRRLVQVFLDEVPVSGIDVEVTDLHRVLVAASAVIPIMGFPQWEYEYLSEVLLYPANFSQDYDADSGEGRILGMVHGALNNGVVIFSEPALVNGFANPEDRRNVGIHEFAHMVDKRDGSIDGVAAALPAELARPWHSLMTEKMQETSKGRGTIDPYSKTNEQEFLAVTTEYFFESPERLKADHPRVYEMLARIYNQDTVEIVKEGYHLLKRHQLGRNDPCPCGSGEKYKHCCLRKKQAS